MSDEATKQNQFRCLSKFSTVNREGGTFTSGFVRYTVCTSTYSACTVLYRSQLVLSLRKGDVGLIDLFYISFVTWKIPPPFMHLLPSDTRIPLRQYIAAVLPYLV